MRPAQEAQVIPVMSSSTSSRLTVLAEAAGVPVFQPERLRGDDEALAALKDGGHLLCTSYFDLEHELFLASIRARGVEILANVRHAFSRDLPDAEGKSVDRWVAVFKK